MLFSSALIIAGIALLYVGAEGLVKGASSLAFEYAIRPGLIGLTVVALGTSMPEFLVNVFAVSAGESPLALGNIIGSNISNVALILGMSALVAPLVVSPRVLRRDYPIMLGVMLLFYGCALDGAIGRADGTIMVLLLGVLWGYLIYFSRRTPVTPLVEEAAEELARIEERLSTPTKVLYIVGGPLGLGLGAFFMVEGAKAIAYEMNIQPAVVGLTVVAVGTSLPELAASVVSSLQGKHNMSIGNVVGSNLLNVLFVVGVVALIEPMEVSAQSLQADFPAMLGFCALVLPLAWARERISRGSGTVLVVAFLGYMTYLLAPYV